MNADNAWHSSVMQIYGDQDDCVVCAFLRGDDLSESQLIEVIRVLDRRLAEREKLAKKLTALLSKLQVARHD